MIALDEETKDKIIKALDSWAAKHPGKDQPAISVATFGEFSPREIVEAVTQETPFGQFFLKMIESATREHPLEKVLRSFAPKAAAKMGRFGAKHASSGND